jgi:hypothetical protein
MARRAASLRRQRAGGRAPHYARACFVRRRYLGVPTAFGSSPQSGTAGLQVNREGHCALSGRAEGRVKVAPQVLEVFATDAETD